jgi:hypothetical protein
VFLIRSVSVALPPASTVADRGSNVAQRLTLRR